jgi:hypothetical protein
MLGSGKSIVTIVKSQSGEVDPHGANFAGPSLIGARCFDE